MNEFSIEKLSAEQAFWVMFYFLKKHFDISKGNFDISDILSDSEPVEFDEKFKLILG